MGRRQQHHLTERGSRMFVALMVLVRGVGSGSSDKKNVTRSMYDFKGHVVELVCCFSVCEPAASFAVLRFLPRAKMSAASHAQSCCG